MNQIKYCNLCKVFTLKEICSVCGGSANTVRPPKFSEIDKYATYRRQALADERKKRGVL